MCTDQDWVNSLESRDSRKSVCSSWGFSLSIKAVLDTAHTDVHIYGQKHTQTHGGWAHKHKRISTHVGYWYLWLRTWSGTHIDAHSCLFGSLSSSSVFHLTAYSQRGSTLYSPQIPSAQTPCEHSLPGWEEEKVTSVQTRTLAPPTSQQRHTHQSRTRVSSHKWICSFYFLESTLILFQHEISRWNMISIMKWNDQKAL